MLELDIGKIIVRFKYRQCRNDMELPGYVVEDDVGRVFARIFFSNIEKLNSYLKEQQPDTPEIFRASLIIGEEYIPKEGTRNES